MDPGQYIYLYSDPLSRWTPDSMCLAMVWAGGGFSIWSTFGTMILCSLGWDHSASITDPMKQVSFFESLSPVLRIRIRWIRKILASWIRIRIKINWILSTVIITKTNLKNEI